MFSSWWSKSSASNFSCELGAAVDTSNCILGSGCFALHSGTRKASGTAVSVFVCSDKSAFDQASTSIKRLKTLRHPSVVTYIDSIDTEKAILLATEVVIGLPVHLKTSSLADDENYLAWGIYQIFKGLSFIHEVGLVHGCLHSGAIFITSGCEWKIFGFEHSVALKAEDQTLSTYYGAKWDGALKLYLPPEARGGTGVTASLQQDLWGLGCVIWETFNGPASQATDFGKLGKIPSKLAPVYKELMSAHPLKRPKPSEKVASMKTGSGYFKSPLIETITFLEEIQIKDDAEKNRFFNGLSEKLDAISPEIAKSKILPELIKAFDYGNAGALILAPVFKIGKHLGGDEYREKIVPSVIKLFSSTDRNARFKLLSQIEHFVEHLNNKIVNDQVYPQIENGFMDREPVIREKTVIAMIHLAAKLNFSNLDESVVMKHFARLLRDEQPGIRTNTTVCLGKVAPYLHYSTRQKVLASAFGSKLKDPFPPTRIAAINALAATQQYYTLQDTSSRILPLLCSAMTDPEKPVRDQAFKVAKGFMDKLEQVSENPSLKEEMEKEVTSTNAQVLSAATSWASWAVGAIGAKFYKSSMKTEASNSVMTPSATASSLPPSSASSESSKSTVRSTPLQAQGVPKLEGIDKDSLNTAEDEGSGWNDDEDWADLDDAPAERTNAESLAWSSPSKTEFGDKIQPSIQSWSNNDWNNADWEANDDDTDVKRNSTGLNQDEKLMDRNEKKLARQLELQARRAKKGPMKLGAKKC